MHRGHRRLEGNKRCTAGEKQVTSERCRMFAPRMTFTSSFRGFGVLVFFHPEGNQGIIDLGLLRINTVVLGSSGPIGSQLRLQRIPNCLSNFLTEKQQQQQRYAARRKRAFRMPCCCNRSRGKHWLSADAKSCISAALCWISSVSGVSGFKV